MYYRYHPFLLVLTICLLCTFTTFAQLQLASYFTDNMVLQQKAKLPFWGTATANTPISITTSWNSKTVKTTSDDQGRWKVGLRTPSYGGPYTITIAGGEYLELKNILIGEVWLCSGQSNMEMPLGDWGKIHNYQEEIINAQYPEIRFLQAAHVQSATPRSDLKTMDGGWQVCSPTTVEKFSAAAYFFARRIWNEKHVPIGLVHSSWGGTAIEAWTSREALAEIPFFSRSLKALDSEEGQAEQKEWYHREMMEWNGKLNHLDKGMDRKVATWASPDLDDSLWKTMDLPRYWRDTELSSFDGTVWFRKNITLSPSEIQRGLMLHFYADDNDEVWFNGKFVGSTKGYDRHRSYSIDREHLRIGENVLTLRVVDDANDGGIYGSAEQLFLQLGREAIPLAGQWKYMVGADLEELPPRPYLPEGQNRPTVLFNAMVHPLLQMPLAGVIWYQGESNVERAEQYKTLFPLMIKDWRARFGQKKMPFYFVQLANFRERKQQPGPSEWAMLRESQSAALHLPNTGMAVTTDIGMAEDIHPKNKQEIGKRLALIALSEQYGSESEFSGPVFKSIGQRGNQFVLKVEHAEGLHSVGKKIRGFQIAGANKIFYWTEAQISGTKIILESDKVADPKAIRYNWADNPDGNIYNGAGLPAVPFRTDNWTE